MRLRPPVFGSPRHQSPKEDLMTRAPASNCLQIPLCHHFPALPAMRRRPYGGGSSMCETPTQLSTREIDGGRLLVNALPNQEIANRLSLSRRHVHAHVASTMRCTQTRSRTHLSVFALCSGVLPLGHRESVKANRYFGRLLSAMREGA